MYVMGKQINNIKNITFRKTYKVINETPNTYQIKNDDGIISEYFKDNFFKSIDIIEVNNNKYIVFDYFKDKEKLWVMPLKSDIKNKCYFYYRDFFNKQFKYENSKINEVNDKMDIKNIKKVNKTEALKQYKEEKANAEIEFAKQQLRIAYDKIDDYDRQIKELEENKKPYLEIVKSFK